MNDTYKYPLYVVFGGKLIPVKHPENWNSSIHAHHYIKKTKYDKNPQWYKDRGVEQKLIFLPAEMHFNLEKSGMSDERFYKKYGIQRQELLFSKKYSDY